MSYSVNIEVSPEFADYIKNMKPPEDKYIIVDWRDGMPVYAKAMAVIPPGEDISHEDVVHVVWRANI